MTKAVLCVFYVIYCKLCKHKGALWSFLGCLRCVYPLGLKKNECISFLITHLQS